MKMHNILSFLLCFPTLLAWGQHFFHTELPRHLEDNPEYRSILEVWRTENAPVLDTEMGGGLISQHP
ncbi:MAG: hypothetical protein KDD01_27335 [Phaeodactylibacter sp.]|nr:hypothetical protein [Phaeodactylibacter sp.]